VYQGNFKLPIKVGLGVHGVYANSSIVNEGVLEEEKSKSPNKVEGQYISSRVQETDSEPLMLLLESIDMKVIIFEL
jgi:hypothetical protein